MLPDFIRHRPRAYAHLLAAVQAEPWMVDESAFHEIVAVLERAQQGVHLSAAEVDEALAVKAAVSKPRQQARARRGIAVIDVFGLLVQRVSHLRISEVGLPIESLVRSYKAAQDDASVDGILMNFDTPGGSIYGLFEAADVLFSYGGSKRKPLWALANPRALSAGSLLASQADKFIATEDADVGSNAVISVHVDMTKANADRGEKYTIMRSTGDVHKDEFTSLEPLSQEARGHLQHRIDEAKSAMVFRLARGRGVSQKKVREEFGHGRFFSAQDALARGMIDRIDTLEGTLDRLASSISRGSTVAVRRVDEGTNEEDTEQAAAGPEGVSEEGTSEAPETAGAVSTDTDTGTNENAMDTTAALHAAESTIEHHTETETIMANEQTNPTPTPPATPAPPESPPANPPSTPATPPATPRTPPAQPTGTSSVGASDVLQASVATLTEQVQTLVAEVGQLRAASAATAAASIRSTIEARLNQYMLEGRITPGEATSELELLLAVDDGLRTRRLDALSKRMVLPASIRQPLVAAELAAAAGGAGNAMPKVPKFLPVDLVNPATEGGRFLLSALEAAGGEDAVKDDPERLLLAAAMIDPTGAQLYDRRN